jgi:hypothetical protein
VGIICAFSTVVIIHARNTVWLITEAAPIIDWITGYTTTLSSTLIGRPRAFPILLTGTTPRLTIGVLTANGRIPATPFVGKHSARTAGSLDTNGTLFVETIVRCPTRRTYPASLTIDAMG